MDRVKYMIGTGSAYAYDTLNAFDRALQKSGFGNYNLIQVSSILPANATRTDYINYKEGALLPCAYAKLIVTPEAEIKIPYISASIAVAIPKDSNKAGVIMEWSGFAEGPVAKNKVERMVSVAMLDRNIMDYEVVSEVITEKCSMDYCTCVFAGIAILFHS